MKANKTNSQVQEAAPTCGQAPPQGTAPQSRSPGAQGAYLRADDRFAGWRRYYRGRYAGGRCTRRADQGYAEQEKGGHQGGQFLEGNGLERILTRLREGRRGHTMICGLCRDRDQENGVVLHTGSVKIRMLACTSANWSKRWSGCVNQSYGGMAREAGELLYDTIAFGQTLQGKSLITNQQVLEL